ncbi:hypothetical protein QQY24_13265 [Streptomyces sp. TG1A-8]|uniref:hypothetical protein n=1 Tax=Streptomyces sp. TG1A-8 TaxID=3051385 RepID=UPI00265C0BCE|nr:hypothetical protein [Streptomyces sp. TG1A-8]MDO0926345.1 hypothetical protein [Streptomyces sp. TG1A-8]
MKEDKDVRRIFLLNPDQRLLHEAAHSGVQVRSAQVDAHDESALRVPLAEAAEAGLCVNPARALRMLSDPEAVQRLVRDNRLLPGGGEVAPDDPRLTVETLSVHGMHQTVGITARMPYGLLHPAPVTDDTAAEVRAVVTGLLDLAGYQYGPAHTGIALTRRGPVITGCRPGLADDPVPELIRVAGGFDLTAGALQVLAGQLVDAVRPNRFAAAAVLCGPWRLEAAEVAALPQVRHVSPPAAGRPGYLVVDADSPEGVQRRLDALKPLVVADVP